MKNTLTALGLIIALGLIVRYSSGVKDIVSSLGLSLQLFVRKITSPGKNQWSSTQ